MDDKPWDKVELTLHYNDGAIRKQRQHTITREADLEVKKEAARQEIAKHTEDAKNMMEGEELEQYLATFPNVDEIDFVPGEFEGAVMEVVRRLLAHPVVENTPNGYKVIPTHSIIRVDVKVKEDSVLVLPNR